MMNQDRFDEYRKKVQETIERVGWMVQGVFDPDGEQSPYVYTIGNFLVGLPEIAMSGLDPNLMMHFVNDVSKKMRDGSLTMKDGLISKEIAQGYDTVFRKVTEGTFDEYFGVLVDYARSKRLSAYQLVFPDKENRFPWDEGCEQSIIDCQMQWYSTTN